MANTRYFVDLSSNNASFDAKAYAAAGHVLVGIKVSQGTGYVNPKWVGWAKDAHANHVSLLLYHFADAVGGDGTAGGASQAQFFIDQINKAGLYLAKHDAICLDVEQLSNLKDPVGFRKGFEAKIRALGFKNLVVYSDAGYLTQFGVGLKPSQGGRIWAAAYPNLPSGWWSLPWGAWAHQYTQTGSVAGIPGNVDVSILNATGALWRKLHRP
jgi:lysozyme